MSLRRSRGYKYILWIATVACVGGAGYLGYRTFFASPSAANELKAAEDAYERGLGAYKAKNWGEASLNFDKAKVLSDKALEAVDAQVKENKLKPEEADPLVGRILWVKTRALRDFAYAESHKPGGVPLNELTDTQFKETYRPIGAIVDREQHEATINALRQAVNKLAGDKDLGKEVVKEALRLELASTAIDWQVAAPLLRKALEFDPTDARANYYMARFEYEQPADNVNPLFPYDRRAADRIERSKEYLAAAKKHGASLWYWRAAGLEAELAAWPVRTAAARKLKKEAVAAAEKAVDDLLFDPATGLVQSAGRGEKFLAGFGLADTRGLVSVMTVGLERAITDAVRPGGTHDRLRLVTRSALDLATKVADEPSLKPHLSEIGNTLVTVAATSQALLSRNDPAGWREYITAIDALLARAPEATAGSPLTRLQLARIAAADADLAVRNSDPVEKIKALRDRTVKEADAGLKAAEAARLPSHQIDEFHLLLTEVKLQAGVRGEDIEPHLARLRLSTVPRFKSIGKFFDARVAERRGYLDKARTLLKAVVDDRTAGNADVAFQAQVLLAGMAQATGDPQAALAALREVESRYNSSDLPPHARAWADQTLGGLETITGGLAVANLGVALQVRAKYLRENPGKTTVPPEQLDGYERAVKGLLEKLKAPSIGDWIARIAYANYHITSGRRAEAVAQFDKLATDYPESIGVLRARCMLLAAPAPGKPLDPNAVAAADLLIRRFNKDYPGNKAGKLFYAEWLMSTGRADEAVKYLDDKDTFPGGRDPSIDRVLAAALARSGRRDEAQKILSKLPADQGLNVTLIRALTPDIGQQLKASLERYEDQGMYRITEAAIKLTEGKYEESARAFASALEFDRVREGAKSGLQMALVAFAEADPAKAREAAIRMAGDYPDQPGVYVAAALAALFLEEAGAPDDNWENTKTMHAAVNRWEAISIKAGVPRADLVAAKAQFRLIAGDIDGAKKEAVTNLNRNAKHVPTMFMLAELNLVPPADPARARDYVKMIRAENADDPRIPPLEAAILVAEDKWAEAAKIYEKAATEFPKSPGVYPPVILVAEKLGNKDAALTWAKKWAEQLPNDASATAEVIRLTAANGKKDEAVKLADEYVASREKEVRDRAKATNPPPPAEETEKSAGDARATALLTAAAALHRAKEHDLAEARLGEVTKTHPKAEGLLLLTGDIAVVREQWDKALVAYRAILDLNPRHFIAGNNAAWILAEKQNKPAEALVLVDAVRKGRSGLPVGPERLPADFLDTIGVVYLKLNDPARAKEMRDVFAAASRRYPADPRMLIFHGHGLAAAGERVKAIEAFDAAIRLTKTKNGMSEQKNKAAAAAAEEAKKKLTK